ncbi:hypothetical protein ES703_81581 [subsurface metagenome]
MKRYEILHDYLHDEIDPKEDPDGEWRRNEDVEKLLMKIHQTLYAYKKIPVSRIEPTLKEIAELVEQELFPDRKKEADNEGE